jgi:hypothetical protein
VAREWFQRKDDVRKEATKWLVNTDRQIQGIHEAWVRLGQPLTQQVPTYNDPKLVDDLTSLAESFMRGAMVLKEDQVCVMRAVQRVKRKKRPSHTNEIKDSIHFEHYLELSRKLHDSAYGQPVIFVSSNSSDFWADKNKPNQPHPELTHDLTAANLMFFGRLALALTHLGILGAAPPSAVAGP